MGNAGQKIKEGFETAGGAIASAGEKAYKGVKRGGEKAYKGIKSTAEKVYKGVKSGGVKAIRQASKALQVPGQWIAKNDPLAKHMGKFGFLSPIGLAGQALTAPATSVGVLGQLATDKKMQKKLMSGDIGTIVDVASAPLGLMPVGSAARGLGKSAITRSTALRYKGLSKFNPMVY